MPKFFRPALLLLFVWLVVWAAICWPACQDDAFIHLRYADHLLHQHFVTFDGIHRTFGASSLLYIGILALLRSLFLSSYLPHAVSVFSHFALFGLLAWYLPRRLRSAPPIAWAMALLLFACLVSPAATRWLQDGMETSLVLCVVTVLALAVDALAEAPSTLGMFLLVLTGFLAELLRVELLVLLGLVALMVVAAHWDRTRRRPTLLHWLTAAAPLAGGLLGAAAIYLLMGTLLPDTAVAKQDFASGHIGVLFSTAQVFLSSFSLGLGILALCVISFVAVIRRRGQLPFAALLANALFPITLFLASMRYQFIQGIRYFIWTLVFTAVWNLLELGRQRSPSGTYSRPAKPGRPAKLDKLVDVSTYALAVLVLVSVAVETPLFYTLFMQRRAVLAEFRSEHLDSLHDLTVVAGDIGFIGYFTQASLCDTDGLVNGRAFAGLGYLNRTRACIAQHPQIAFVNQFQMVTLHDFLPGFVSWSYCSTSYEFANLRHPDVHYLLSSPALASRVCAAANASPLPVTNLLPPPPTPR